MTLDVVGALGGGAFSRVFLVQERKSRRQYALKSMLKATMVKCPKHVFLEQKITKNINHPFTVRQFASFKDDRYLYFLMEHVPAGDLMDVLVSDAHVVQVKQGGCFSSKSRSVMRALPEHVVKFYVAYLVLTFEYLHGQSIIYRDLKPENVLVGADGYPKLADFGFAKILYRHSRTYTFSGSIGGGGGWLCSCS
jgi:cGMP-dependent protein kinase 2